jgi:hypothetical protein
MKNFRISLLALITLLFTVFTVDAGELGTRAIIEVEVIKGDNVEKSTEIFKMPECEAMDDDEVEEKAKFLFYRGKLAL